MPTALRTRLAARRLEIVERWDRQLRAAAEAGFALDGDTRRVLPALLDALDAALERRFRPAPQAATRAEGAAHRAAVQASLLGDYLRDELLHPSAADEHAVSAALLHGAVFAQVSAAVHGEDVARRRDAQRLSRMLHRTRNALTAARLSLGLMRPSRLTAALTRAVDELGGALEDAALDELVAAGLRCGRLPVAPLLGEASDAARALGHPRARIATRAPRSLAILGDRRVLRPTLRRLVHAALHAAAPRSELRLEAEAHGGRARLRVAVAPCTTAPPHPALPLARRIARAHGGSLSVRRRGATCSFDLAIPAAVHGE